MMDNLFHIFKISLEDAVKIAESADHVHNHDFEELIVGIEGELEHFIDFKAERFVSPFISFVTKGKVHGVKPCTENNKFDIWVIEFKSEFIPEMTFQLYSYYHDHANLPMQKGDSFNRMVTMCELMHNESLQNTPDYAVIRLLLNTLFTMIESERRKGTNSDKRLYSTQNITFKNFLTILEENFRRPEGVDFYAEKLFMSSRNLNLICHNILQKSVSEIIETRKLIEAKNILVTTNKTVSEIGFELGYNEKSYFTNVFRRKSGQTPTEFRNEMNSLIS
jgi:AraC family transcriptional regulator, transcriptional activator of pobA